MFDPFGSVFRNRKQYAPQANQPAPSPQRAGVGFFRPPQSTQGINPGLLAAHLKDQGQPLQPMQNIPTQITQGPESLPRNVGGAPNFQANPFLQQYFQGGQMQPGQNPMAALGQLAGNPYAQYLSSLFKASSPGMNQPTSFVPTYNVGNSFPWMGAVGR